MPLVTQNIDWDKQVITFLANHFIIKHHLVMLQIVRRLLALKSKAIIKS